MRQDIPLMHKGLTRLFAQQRVRVTVENEGSISAEGMSLEIRSGNTVLHSAPYWVLIAGPSAPHPRMLSHHYPRFDPHSLVSRHREPFSFYWDERGPGDHLFQSCTSFRQGKSHDVEISVELLGTSVPTAQIEAIVTASNMKGDARGLMLVEIERVEVPFDEVYDVAESALKRRPQVDLPDRTDADDLTWFRNGGSDYERI